MSAVSTTICVPDERSAIITSVTEQKAEEALSMILH